MAIPPTLARSLYVEAGAQRWPASDETFVSALHAALTRRFPDTAPDEEEISHFLRSLHLPDLALACACRDGIETAWDHLLREYRPVLQAAARTIARSDAHDLVESLFAELYGLPNTAGVRVSLLAHYHGRARLSTWLRSVLAQRLVDAYRTSRRTVPLDEAPAGLVSSPAASTTDPHRSDHLPLMQRALDAAIQALEAGDRLRLRLYYGQSMKLATIGRLLGESEATASRKLERARRALRDAVERRLREEHRLAPDAIQACFAAAESAPEIDASSLLEDR